MTDRPMISCPFCQHSFAVPSRISQSTITECNNCQKPIAVVTVPQTSQAHNADDSDYENYGANQPLPTPPAALPYRELSAPEYVQNDDAFTLHFLFKASAKGAILILGDRYLKQWQMLARLCSQHGHFDLFIHEPNRTHLTIQQDLCDNQWHHIAITRSQTQIALYLDGTMQDQSTNCNIQFNGDLPLWIGGHPRQRKRKMGTFEGQIQAVQTCNSAYPNTKISTLATTQLNSVQISNDALESSQHNADSAYFEDIPQDLEISEFSHDDEPLAEPSYAENSLCTGIDAAIKESDQALDKLYDYESCQSSHFEQLIHTARQANKRKVPRHSYKEVPSEGHMAKTNDFTLGLLLSTTSSGAFLISGDRYLKKWQMIGRINNRNGHLEFLFRERTGDVEHRITLHARQDFRDGTWRHIAITRTGGLLSLFVNEDIHDSHIDEEINFDGDLPFWMGGHPRQKERSIGIFRGRMRSLASYRKALDPNRIRAIANKRLAPYYSDNNNTSS